MSTPRIVMLRLFRYLCTEFNIISYDKHDNRTIPLIYDDWKQSGLSVQQYCENTGLTEGRFYYRRAKIQAESLPSSCGSFILVKMSGNTSVCSAKNASGKALCEIVYPTLNSLKILQESSKIPGPTPKI